jgi:hypothetical protein
MVTLSNNSNVWQAGEQLSTAWRSTMKIGEDFIFHNVTLRWKGNDLTITIRNQTAAQVNSVVSIFEEYGYDRMTDQALLHLKFLLENGQVRAFFLDYDNIQTNIREVSPDPKNLQDLLNWLLPREYLVRQGDIAFYERYALPVIARIVDIIEFQRVLYPLIGARHRFEADHKCDFLVANDRFFIVVHEVLRLVHPEHKPVVLKAGYYELLIARGSVLPEEVFVRQAKPSFFVT